MDADIFTAAWAAGMQILSMERLLFLSLGVIIGLFIGVLPGLGGLTGLTILLPFTFSMDPITAMAFLLGLLSVTTTSDTIPAILFGVPGEVSGQATVVDGYPMSRQGRAPEALGAAFSAALLGGLFGAAVLAISIPILRPIMLSLATPELLSVIIVGISMVAVLSGTAPMKGLVIACLGLWLSTIGSDSQTGTLRWTFGSLHLYEGISIGVVALGLFAIPEIVTLVLGRVSITKAPQDTGPRAQIPGVVATMKNLFLVFRCSSIGAIIGAMPGAGLSVLGWITYAHAKATVKDADKTFGKGDVRGVIAPESANNANLSGSLIPTIAFGIPGGAAMAIILGAFVIQGITPGPEMLTKHLDVTYSMVWSIALANVLGAGICFLAAGYLARMVLIPVPILAPIVFSLIFLGAYQVSNSWEDVWLLFLFGFIGLIMKLRGWPRPPLVLGFVLGGIAERYAFISTSRYGWEWLTRPIVVVLLAIALLFLLQPLIKDVTNRLRNRIDEDEPSFSFRPIVPKLDGHLFTLLGFAGLFIFVLMSSNSWHSTAKFYPNMIATAGLICLGAHALGRYVFNLADTGAGGLELGDEDVAGVGRRELVLRFLKLAGMFAIFVATAHLAGFMIAMGTLVFAFVWLEGRRSISEAALYGLGMFVASYLIFHLALRLPWPDSLLGGLVPQLNRARWTDIF